MDKQILKSVDSDADLHETGQQSIAQAKSRASKRHRVLLLVAGVLIFIVACAVVVVAVGASQAVHSNRHKAAADSYTEKKGTRDPSSDIATEEHQLKQEVASIRAKRRGRRGHEITSCYSKARNGSHTAAHISGTGDQWDALDNVVGYPTNGDWDTQWICANDSDAFVDGGMIFNQTDKKLYVPTCGYYSITSQLYFFVELESSTNTNASDATTVYHVQQEMIIDRNCHFEDDRVLLRSYSSLLVNTTSNLGKTSTQIGDVVKICSGGSIYMHIPHNQYNPCCPYGRFQTTYLSAVLVSETDCKPPRSSPTVII